MRRICAVLIVLFGFLFPASGQLFVDFPIENAIYQRKKTNVLDVVITGRYSDSLTTSIQARLLNATTLLPVSGFNWQLIDSLPQLGKFRSTLSNVPGGRYHLQIRNLNGLIPLDTVQVNKIGIGEVFMISGQSNASGVEDDLGYNGAVSAQSDLVLTHNQHHNDQNGNANTTNFPTFPSLSKIEYDYNLSLKGRTSWCYGKLGDLLTTRLNVPVAFFNGASEGTTSENWRASSLGQFTGLLFKPNEQYGGLTGMPYLHFRMTMNFYASQFGTRANLWHQGEGDTIAGTSTTTYKNNLDQVIAKSREHFDPNLTWMISRASYTGSDSSAQVIGGQNLTVIGDNNAFYGPETDRIKSRDPEEGIHFFGSSLVDLANEWDLELDTDFFQNSTPILPKPVQEIKLSYKNGQVWLIAPPGFAAYRWINVTSGNKNYEQIPESTKGLIKKVVGKFMCYLTEANGNIIPSQIIDVTAALNAYNKNPAVCESVTYLSDLTEASSTNNYNKDKSQQNTTLTIDGEQFTKGLGSHSYFKIKYALPGNTYKRFKSFIGVDDSVTSANCVSHDGVQYKVYGDDPNTPIFTSQILNADSPIQYIDIPVETYDSLTFEVLQVGNFNCDHADWADAKLTGSSVTSPTISVDKPIINSDQTVNLSASVACPVATSLRWSDGVTTATNSRSLATTTSYFATCLDSPNKCQSLRSNTVLIKVLKDCENNYTLVSPGNDLNNTNLNLTYKVSGSIQASNKLQNNTKVIFDAKNSITLSPGFTSDSGTTFTAKIGGCAN